MGVPYHFNYYADVFYGTDYDTDIDSYYESASGTQENEIAAERLRGKGFYEANEGVLIKAIKREIARARPPTEPPAG